MSQSLPWLTWIYAAQTLISFFFGVGVFIFIAIRASDHSQAKKYALIGFSIQLLVTIVGLVAPVILSQLISMDSLGTGIMLINFAGNLLQMVSTGFIVAAIVTGRRPGASVPPSGTETERPRTIDGQNPYAV
ncbi:hypothetical protein [Rubripirellula lacrimiformis]|uniref:hypothetical protein n=1 Tax=Rubripirellula lacrimiformis TaxID=1930273 RepID=UPI00119DAF06|nr:hypothetical protein [Rubripirellula lacrimiformis]